LQIAVGSADELDYHLLLAADLCYLSSVEHQGLGKQLIAVRRMLIRLAQRLKSARNV